MANETAATKKVDNPVLSVIHQAKSNLAARLPQGIDPDKFFLGILTAIHKSKANSKPGQSLADCNPNSVLLAAYDAAEVGCSLSPSLQLGWLINYAGDAVFQPSYRFFIQKAYQTGEVKTFYAEVVHKGDQLDRQFAPKRNLFHAPGPRTEVKMTDAIGAYALIEFMDGTIDWEYLTAEQIDRHRKASKQPNSMKWTTFWEEGWRITPIRVLAKRLPLRSRNFEEMIELVNKDEDRELVLNVEEIKEPSAPRKLESTQPTEPVKTATPKQEPKTEPRESTTTVETTETSTQAQEQPAVEEQQEAAPQAGNGSGGTLFEGGEDPTISSTEITEFWNKVFAAGWKKNEAAAHLQKTYGVNALKDLRRSQMVAALNEMSSGTGKK